VVGASTFLLLPDRPSMAKWLSPDEARFLELSHRATRGLKRRNDDGETARRLSRWTIFKMVAGDYHLWLQSLVFMSNTVPNYGLKFTMPQIIKNMGFQKTNGRWSPSNTSGHC